MEYSADTLTDMAEEFLARLWPDSLLVRELSIGDWGSARIDVAAITPEFIVGVEVKGIGDSIQRLAMQAALYGKAARYMFLLATPSLYEKVVKCRREFELLKPMNNHCDFAFKHQTRTRVEKKPQPVAPRQILQALCGNELKHVCKLEGIPTKGMTTVKQWTDAIVEALPLPVIERRVCELLRSRNWDWKGIVGQRDGSKRVRWANA